MCNTAATCSWLLMAMRQQEALKRILDNQAQESKFHRRQPPHPEYLDWDFM